MPWWECHDGSFIWHSNVLSHCRCFWLTTAWQRSTVTTEHGSIYRTARTKTWQAQLGMQVWMLTLVSSRVDVMTWNLSAMFWCTSTAAHCHGKDLRWDQPLLLLRNLVICVSIVHFSWQPVMYSGILIKHVMMWGINRGIQSQVTHAVRF